MNLSHRTEQGQRRAATRAAGVKPKHIEVIPEDAPTQTLLGLKMALMARREGKRSGLPRRERGADKKQKMATFTMDVLRAFQTDHTAQELAEKMGATRSRVSGALQTLKANGLVEKAGECKGKGLWRRVVK